MTDQVATHGKLGLATPWARQRLAAGEARDAVEALIPAGHVLGVSAEQRAGIWTIWLLDADRRQLWRELVVDGHLDRACLAALRRHGIR